MESSLIFLLYGFFPFSYMIDARKEQLYFFVSTLTRAQYSFLFSLLF